MSGFTGENSIKAKQTALHKSTVRLNLRRYAEGGSGGYIGSGPGEFPARYLKQVRLKKIREDGLKRIQKKRRHHFI